MRILNNIKMKNFSLATGLMSILVLCFFVSCKEEEEKAGTDQLIANPWNISELTIKITQGVFSFTIDGYDELDECSKDDQFIFLDDGVLNVSENNDVCPGSSGGVIMTGNWAMEASTLQITSEYFDSLIENLNESAVIPIQYSNDRFDFEVRQLTSTVMKLFYKELVSDSSNPLMSYNLEVNVTFNADVD